MLVNIWSILLLGLLAAPAAAGAAWIAKKGGWDWTARQRVFNSAAIVPAIIASGAVCFAVVILTLGDGQKFAGADNFLVQAITAILVAFASGMVAAYLVERATTP